MKVLVVGANGQIGKHLVQQLQSSEEHTVRAVVRKEEQKNEFEKLGVETRIADLEGSVEDIAKAAEGCDAVVFTAGSGGHTGADKTILVDLDGAVKTIEAAQKLKIKRYIMVSSIRSNRREEWTSIQHYLAAKYYADKALEQSGLTYTILRPGRLLNEPGTGKIAAAEQLEYGSIPREDVASTIVTALTMEETYHRSFDMVSGEKEIVEALRNL